MASFRGILAQLEHEHDKEIADLQKDIHLLREQLATYANNKGEVEGTPFEAGAYTKKVADERPNTQDERANGNGAEFGIKQSKQSLSSSADYMEMPSMALSLDDLPEEPSAGVQMAEFLADSYICSMCGLSRDRVDRWINWWTNLREPDSSYPRLRQFVDGNKFQSFVMLVILLNTLYILYSTEEDMQKIMDDPDNYHSIHRKKVSLVIDLCFTSIYVIELGLRIFVHRWFFLIHSEWRWNIFDSILVAFSLYDTSAGLILLESHGDGPNSSFLRSLRITRISKTMRLIRAVRWIQELRLMLDCVMNSFVHLFWCVMLILFVLVMFSLLLVQGMTTQVASKHKEDIGQYEKLKSDIDGLFDSIPHAMLSLFKATTGGEDWNDVYVIIDDAGRFYAFLFLFYIAFFCIVAWNIVMSTFVEKTFKLAIPDVDTLMLEKRRKDLCYSRELFQIIRSRLDADHSGSISREEFKQHFDDPELRKWFDARNFDMKDAELFFNMLASVGKKQEVDVSTFVMGCMRLRGTASNIDLQALHYDIRTMYMKQHLHIKCLSRLTEQLIGYLDKSPAPHESHNEGTRLRDDLIEITM